MMLLLWACGRLLRPAVWAGLSGGWAVRGYLDSAAFPGCFLLLPCILLALLSRFVAIRDTFSAATSSLPLLSSPLFPSLQGRREGQPIVLDDGEHALHTLPTPYRTRVSTSSTLGKRVEHRSLPGSRPSRPRPRRPRCSCRLASFSRSPLRY
jgi:hypothetical protein